MKTSLIISITCTVISGVLDVISLAGNSYFVLLIVVTGSSLTALTLSVAIWSRAKSRAIRVVLVAIVFANLICTADALTRLAASRMV